MIRETAAEQRLGEDQQKDDGEDDPEGLDPTSGWQAGGRRRRLRGGLRKAVPVALAADTISITVMEIVDSAVMLGVPGAMDAGLASPLFWGALAFALAVAFVGTVPVNRWPIAKSKGHAVAHQYHQPSTAQGDEAAHAGRWGAQHQHH